MAARSGVAVIGSQSAAEMAGRRRSRVERSMHELHDRASRFADDLVYEIESMPEVENLRNGTTRGASLRGVSARDRLLTGVAIAGSTAVMVVAYLLAC